MKALAKTGVFLLVLFQLCSPAFGAGPKILNLCEFHYPSDDRLAWYCQQVTEGDSPYRIFGKYWKEGLRFNRMDRRHFIAGLWIKVPRQIRELKDFNPLPEFYQEAEKEPQFILVDQDEMFLGAYEYGDLVFSTPVAVGMEGHRLQNGSYRVDASDLRHESSLYQVEKSDRPYPMHYGLRFFVDKKSDDWTSYWLHGRDVPGYPASHGCIGLYDEEMQKEYYHDPSHPTLMDAKRLYQWVVGDDGDESGNFRDIKKGPKVLIMGAPPELAEPATVGSPPSKLVPGTEKQGERSL